MVAQRSNPELPGVLLTRSWIEKDFFEGYIVCVGIQVSSGPRTPGFGGSGADPSSRFLKGKEGGPDDQIWSGTCYSNGALSCNEDKALAL